MAAAVNPKRCNTHAVLMYCGYMMLMIICTFRTVASGAAAVSTSSSSNSSASKVIVVAQDGTGNFRTVQSAIDSLPAVNTRPVTIVVKRGVYNQKIRVPFGKSFITLQGQSGAAATFLQWSDTAYIPDKTTGKLLGTYASASVAIEANDFVAIGISFKAPLLPPSPYLLLIISLPDFSRGSSDSIDHSFVCTRIQHACSIQHRGSFLPLQLIDVVRIIC
jgi:pectin methylesterase-like acyl-CoA thioesterase